MLVDATSSARLSVYKSRRFARFQRQEGITDAALWEAVKDAENGLIDADLGGGVIKQRVARAGGGKRSGFRTIICYRKANRAVFVHGFAKSGVANLTPLEAEVYKALAVIVLGHSNAELKALSIDGAYLKVERPFNN